MAAWRTAQFGKQAQVQFATDVCRKYFEAPSSIHFLLFRVVAYFETPTPFLSSPHTFSE